MATNESMQRVVVCFVFISCICCIYAQTAIYNDWITGRSTYYTDIDGGACSYQTISTDSFPYGYIAAPNEDFWDGSRSCGECYEVQCLGDYDGETANCCNIDSSTNNNSIVTIEITDVCPEDDNTEWCSGDIDHFDLSEAAFDVIANTNCGVISMQYRRVSCDFESNLMIRNKDGINAWWYALFVENVAGYGRISQVELRDSSDDYGNVWFVGETTTYNGYVFSSGAANGWELPYSIRVTDSSGRNVTSIDLITDLTEDKEFDFGTNFEVCVYTCVYPCTVHATLAFNILAQKAKDCWSSL